MRTIYGGTTDTTALEDATHLYFSGGFLGQTTSGVYFHGAIDNLLIDDASFATGRPIGRRIDLGSDNTLSGWSAAGGAATVTGGLTSTGTARGSGVGATALLNLASVTTTGWETELLGFQIVASGFSNLDPLLSAKLRTGISLSGTPYHGTEIDDYTPPMTPSVLTPARNLDTVFYKGGTTSFVLSDIPNCKPRLEVV
ncbi:MAG: hypothetical protein ACKO3N_11440 [Verrucomicrobiota bacterium]